MRSSALKQKSEALRLVGDMNLVGLQASIKKAKGNFLEVFFAAKTHKTDIPFRCIVTERGTWQHAVSSFLQSKLCSLTVEDPFLVSNSEAVVQYLKLNNPGGCDMFSIDVQDLFYSLPHDRLLQCVKKCIVEDNDEEAFISKCGVSVGSFLELVSFYLKSTFVDWEGRLYVQKTGVCIGSKVAPVLSNIFLSYADRSIKVNLDNRVKQIFRYVDDYLVFVESHDFKAHVDDILKTFENCGFGLKFTFELPEDNQLQFLDIRLEKKVNHVCWSFLQRSEKPLLNYQSGHSKIVKCGIAVSCLGSALTKSCIHTLGSSFDKQVQRLRSAGFPKDVIALASNKILKKMKSFGRHEAQENSGNDRTKYAVIPYIHQLSHRLKQVGTRYGVKVLFSVPNKLGKVCAIVDKRAREQKQIRGKRKNACQVDHESTFVPCAEGVVYDIPFKCGKSYIGQTGKCINTRLRQHRTSLNGAPSSNLSLHYRDCLLNKPGVSNKKACFPLLNRAKIKFRHPDQLTRELCEAYHIHKNIDTCVSTPSVNLHECEILYLDF